MFFSFVLLNIIFHQEISAFVSSLPLANLKIFEDLQE